MRFRFGKIPCLFFSKRHIEDARGAVKAGLKRICGRGFARGEVAMRVLRNRGGWAVCLGVILVLAWASTAPAALRHVRMDIPGGMT